MSERFRVGLTRDCTKPSGELVFGDIALDVLRNARNLHYELIDELTPEITQEQASAYDAIVVLAPKVTANTLAGPNRRVKLFARVGVGYDNIDTAACTQAGVLLTITPDGVRRPVATVILTFVLALSLKLFVKDRLTRTGQWGERTNHMGEGLVGKTIGSVGLGNIGCEAFRLLRPLDMKHIAHDPAGDPKVAAELGVRLVELDTVMCESDFVMINCPLLPSTRGLIGARQLGLMKPSAYFINTARGPIANEAALYRALSERRIAGAALDVFEQEPTPVDNPILKLDNVITTPHSLCWTDECFRLMAEGAFSSTVAVSQGQVPPNIVNRVALSHAQWYGKAERG
jgi:phosphoglycerate dehydrogenase-like enzyme